MYVQMHEMKWQKDRVTDTLGQKDPWLRLLPAPIPRTVSNVDHLS